MREEAMEVEQINLFGNDIGSVAVNSSIVSVGSEHAVCLCVSQH
jgi:hypothetical protein